MPNTKVLLVTPPFTQLNTPYPGTNYLKGYLNTIGVNSFQMDLGIEVILMLFSKAGLTKMFSQVDEEKLSDNGRRMVCLQDEYLDTADAVISFLQNKNPTLAYSIAERDFLPEASRFDELQELEWAFGSLGIQDKARHFATLYLEDLADLIKEAVDPNFGFSRYAERLGLSASSFDPIYEALEMPMSVVDELSIQVLKSAMDREQPQLVCLSVPFPGNLFGAFRIGQYIKANYPEVKIAMGGGYPNTELRSLTDARVFEFVDYITLDDGERPVQNLIAYIEGKREQKELKRCWLLQEGEVVYVNGSKDRDVPFGQVGTPSYADMALDSYLSVIEVTNPMHRLWSDGRWNKLTMAHGCYWKKCSFCDISLDYIKNYEPVSAAIICDRMEVQIAETGETGFHFVDEAAPPALMKEVALEILKRGMVVTWWTNIRFEKRFSPDLCRLLKASGCIAVSGGLEVASDRLLDKMKKGVTITQVAQVADNFTQSGIMVHAYLMYGFPTQTDQETIDSLEMVRQLFEQGVVQSGFWHQFAMTAHAPTGMKPEDFGVKMIGPEFEGFAKNDLWHEDKDGANHVLYSDGLKKSLFNYMHGACFDFPMQEWFDFAVSEPTVHAGFITDALEANPGVEVTDHAKVVWLGKKPLYDTYIKRKKGKETERARLALISKSYANEVIMDVKLGEWWMGVLEEAEVRKKESLSFAKLKASYEQQFGLTIDQLFKEQSWHEIKNFGLLII